jgi:rare lipoprotein A
MRLWNRVWCRRAQLGAVGLGCLTLAACSGTLSSTVDPRYGVASSPRVVEYGQPVPKGGGTYRVGTAYVVAGRTYVPEENAHYRAEGIASWYGTDFHGRLTANGEIYDMDAISAAHPTLPMPCYVRVTNLGNHRSMIVRVNDRGPYAATREIDLSGKAAELLGFRGNGIARVRVEYVSRAPLEGSSDQALFATLRVGEPAPPPAGIMLASSRSLVPVRALEGPALSGSVPMPLERPFEFGDGPPVQSRTSSKGAALRAPAVAPAARETPRIPASTVSAYTPVRYDEPPALASGRGLY